MNYFNNIPAFFAKSDSLASFTFFFTEAITILATDLAC